MRSFSETDVTDRPQDDGPREVSPRWGAERGPLGRSALRALGSFVTRRRGVPPDVYARLREVAGRVHRGERACTVGVTGLVHEAYLRLPQDVRDAPADHLGVVHREMRHVVVERARARNRQKRWGTADRASHDAIARLSSGAEPEAQAHGTLDLAAALDRLGRTAPRLRAAVRLRYERGLTVGEVSDALGVPRRTTERDLARARARLRVLLGARPPLD